MNGVQSVVSAVIIPDAEETAAVPSPSSKRRFSSASEDSSKRPRLSEGANGSATSPPPSANADRPRAKPLSKNPEERKRGKRLFGALLGALNQSSSTAAQKRRGDIERKQQEKLKQLDQEHDESKRQNKASLLVARRRAQKAYDRQSIRIRHDNMLAMAHFLQTKAEPRLYYKPWELNDEEKSQIDRQVEEAKTTIEKEVGEQDTAETDTENDPRPSAVKDAEADAPEATAMARSTEANSEVQSKDRPMSGINIHRSHSEERSRSRHDAKPEHANSDDGGGDLVKGDEDDVMY